VHCDVVLKVISFMEFITIFLSIDFVMKIA
jgi:hypothetical protein